MGLGISARRPTKRGCRGEKKTGIKNQQRISTGIGHRPTTHHVRTISPHLRDNCIPATLSPTYRPLTRQPTSRTIKRVDSRNCPNLALTNAISAMNINTSALPNARPNATSTVMLGLVNACSVRNKTDVFTDRVTDANIDLVAITETWFNPGDKDPKTVKDLAPVGNKFVHAPRKNQRGVASSFLDGSIFKFTVNNNKQAMQSFEFMDIDVTSSASYIKHYISSASVE